MSTRNLGINEALLSLNRINISSSVEVYHQIDECFGCPLTKSKGFVAADSQQEFQKQEQFILSTKHNLQLELRQLDQGNSPNSTRPWCRLDDVALNSHGQYRIDVSPTSKLTGGGVHQTLNCVLKTIDSGECLLCPFAILICVLFAIVALEQVYRKFWVPRRTSSSSELHYGRADRKLSSPDGTAQIGSDGDSATSSGDVGQQVDEDNLNRRPHDVGTLAAETQPRRGCSQSNATQEVSSMSLKASPKRRIECLDTFRGLTLAGMIFVNYGGAGYAIWEHKAWDGITLADFVFPFFIFSMGASIAISAGSMIKRHQKSFHAIAVKILKRSVILALLGFCLNSKWINYEQADGLSKLRLTGVLQRFAVSYMVIAFMYTIELTINKWTRAQSLSNVPYLNNLIGIILELFTAVNYLAIYVYMTFYFEFDSNCPVGYTGPGGMTDGGKFASCTGGTAAWLDRLLLGTNHMYNDHEVKETFKTQVSHDPEGLLGYTTSILLTLIGLQCGKILICGGDARNGTVARPHRQKLFALGQWIVALALASSLVLVMPVNKRLWSLTFVIVTALAAFAIISMLYIMMDIYSCRKSFLLRLLSSAGKNSIFLYVGHSLIFGMLPWWFPIGDQTSHLQLLLRLAWSTFTWLLVAHYMALKGLFIRI